MLYISQLIYDVFQLVLVSDIKFSLYSLYKDLKFLQASSKEDFEFGLGEKYYGLDFYFLFILFLLV